MIGKILGNRYEILEKIGGGGMAIVYRAKCILLNRYVAVKILRPEFTNDKDLIDKFKRESQSAASLSHPNIVNLYDVGQENEIYYIVMEYVDGCTLKELIREKGILPVNDILVYSKQIALALQHAHSNHIIHRDIKPHNILITKDNRVKVADFGIALAATSSTLTNAGSIIGSVHYFSPEQARGGYIDEKSDLYSLGIVMYEMATGRVPFEGDTPVTIALKHIQEEPVTPSKFNPSIPEGLIDIIKKLTQKEQSLRYKNAQEVISDLSLLKNNINTRYAHNLLNETDSPTQKMDLTQIAGIKKTADKKEAKKKNKNKMLIGTAVAAALLAALLFTFGLYYVSNWITDNEVDVPNFLEMEIAEARQRADEIGLKLEEKTAYNNEVEKNRIISQNPAEGIKVKQGYPVRVTVSLGKKLVAVPNLIDENIIDVESILQDEGLRPGRANQEFSDMPSGTVIAQNPGKGENVPEGTKVDYWVSLGPEPVTRIMPNLVGETIEKATTILNEMKLIIKSTEEYSNQYDKNIVIHQSISSGSEVQENQEISLIVSKGKEALQPTQPQDNVGGGNGTTADPLDVSDNGTQRNRTTRTIDIDLQNYTGIVDVRIMRIKRGQEKEEVFNKKFDLNQTGSIIRASITDSGNQTFEIYVNGKIYGEPINIIF